MLVNVVDVPSLCNFILPAIVRTGPLAIAISTAGASPALAKRIKREIAETFGEPYARPRGDPQRRPRLGQGDPARPTRTARSSSRGSSTAIPTRSSWSARAASARCSTLIEAAKHRRSHGRLGRLDGLDASDRHLRDLRGDHARVLDRGLHQPLLRDPQVPPMRRPGRARQIECQSCAYRFIN